VIGDVSEPTAWARVRSLLPVAIDAERTTPGVGPRLSRRSRPSSSSLLGGGVCRLVHDIDGGPARFLIGR
jgi:hypothetical protein